jgi:hypothetical protein
MAEKYSKEAVNYGPAVNDQLSCASCVFFNGDDCDKVKGHISPTMTCDLFTPIARVPMYNPVGGPLPIQP